MTKVDEAVLTRHDDVSSPRACPACYAEARRYLEGATHSMRAAEDAVAKVGDLEAADHYLEVARVQVEMAMEFIDGIAARASSPRGLHP